MISSSHTSHAAVYFATLHLLMIFSHAFLRQSRRRFCFFYFSLRARAHYVVTMAHASVREDEREARAMPPYAMMPRAF